MEARPMAAYLSPVNPEIYMSLAILLLTCGFFFSAWFFVYEVTVAKRRLLKELSLSLVSACFLGVGVVFLLNSLGIYV